MAILKIGKKTDQVKKVKKTLKSKLDPGTLALFWRYPGDDAPAIHKKLLDLDKGPYLYFRRIKTPIQARFAQLMDHQTMPVVFLHGSPHLDNYVKTQDGAGIIDFDRAHYGPYGWDIVCLLVSLGLRNPLTTNKALPAVIAKTFKKSYLLSFQHPEQEYKEYMPLAKVHPKPWETSTATYLAANKKWGKKLQSHAISTEDPLALAVLNEYLKTQPDVTLLKSYTLDSAARCYGSFGRARFLYALSPPARLKKKQDRILLDIKQTRNYMNPHWPHNRWYRAPLPHQGERMIAASRLYAPRCMLREGHATVNGEEYWGRQVPPFSRKPAKLINQLEQIHFANAAGSQLGRAHRLSLQVITPDQFLNHFNANYDRFVAAATQLNHEIFLAWKTYTEVNRVL